MVLRFFTSKVPRGGLLFLGLAVACLTGVATAQPLEEGEDLEGVDHSRIMVEGLPGPADLSYLGLPEQSRPLDHILPTTGIDEEKGILKVPETISSVSHSVDFQTREVTLERNMINRRDGTKTRLWSSSYNELGDYANDLNALALKNLWLNSLIGQEKSEVPDEERPYDIEIPVKLPSWLKKFELDKPKLELQGSMVFSVSGRGRLVSGSPGTSLWPGFNPDFEPRLQVKGRVGRYITVEVKTTDEFSVRNDLRVIYKESKPGEFEDHILQEVEVGSTSLSLPGTELTGYSENHKGLFGVKSRWKIGPVNLTAIASQEGGSQESYTINARSQATEYSIRDKEFVSFRHYFLNLSDRKEWVSMAVQGRQPSTDNKPGLVIYTLAPANAAATSSNIVREVTAIYYDAAGRQQIYRTNMTLRMMSGGVGRTDLEWSWDPERRTLSLNRGARDGFYAATWSNPDGLSVGSAGIPNGGQVVVFKTERDEIADLQPLMQRNRYSIGANATQSSFVMRVLNQNNASANNRGISYLTLLGLADENGSLLRNDKKIFTEQGELILPCQRRPYYGDSARGVPADWAEQVCLEPFRIIDSASAPIYDTKARNLNRVESRYRFSGTAQRRQTTLRVSDQASVGGGGCMDIAEGSEKLKAGSTTLQRGIDYEVIYELGQIELVSERAKDPNTEISVSYECEPLFTIENKLLFGLRGEVPFKKLGEDNLFGVTMLYRSQKTSELTPHFGAEPFSSFLWGANIRLTHTASWMDSLINALPLINSKKKSRWLFEAEVAQSLHNPNTKGSALLDDFENSKRELPFPLRRTSWYPASPPGGVGPLADDPLLDYRHQGELIWHSNTEIHFSRIYGKTGSSTTDRTNVPILQLNLTPNDNLQGHSWGGIMRANSDYYADMSTYRYIELVVRGSQGSLYIDFGRVSEDISINGAEPNGQLDSEGNIFTGVQEHDYGLDALPSSQETALRWECIRENCTQFTIAGTKDPAGDDYEYESQKDASNPDRRINGTEGNNNDTYGGKGFDTEDLNGSGSLDTEEEFVRYKIDLNDNLGYEKLLNGWRRYKIPLEQIAKVVSPEGVDASRILENAAFTRFWIGSLPAGVGEATVQIARFSVVGNQWEGSERSDAYESPNDINRQQSVVDGSRIDLDYDIPSSEPDSNSLKVRVINTRDDIGTYSMSPNVTAEEDADGIKQREQSLVLEFKDLHPGQSVTATRYFDGEFKDLTQYSKLAMEIHLDQDPGASSAGKIRFALQMGQGSLESANEYYEWSFRPTPSSCMNLASDREKESCHEQNWKRNRFQIGLQEWSQIKANPKWAPDGALWVSQSRGGDTAFVRRDDLNKWLIATRADTASDSRREVFGVIGNPNLGKINWMRMVISVDEDLPATELAEGEFWIDDLRLDGVRSGWGSAGRVATQLDFADVLTLSGDAFYKDGNFASMSSDQGGLPTLAKANSSLQYRGDLKFQINKFMPDEWKVSLPLSLSYVANADRPWLKPQSDLSLSHDDLGDLAGDLLMLDRQLAIADSIEEELLRRQLRSKGWQDWRQTRSFSLSYKKDYVKSKELWREMLGQVLFDRPTFNWRWSQSTLYGSQAIDTTDSYNTRFAYALGRLGPQKRRFFNPWPETFNLLLLDFNFSRNKNQIRDPERVQPTEEPVTNYILDLNHSININWNLFSFLNLGYDLDLYRDMRSEREAFGKENLFSTDSHRGFLGWKSVAAFDNSDWDTELTERAAIRYDTLISSSGLADSVVQRESRYYDVGSVRQRELGEDYGILLNERNRRQNFRIGFQPKLFNFVDLRSNYQGNFELEKTIPDNYDPWDATDVDGNYWTAGRTSSFDFMPRLRMQKILPKAKGWQALLKKSELGPIDLTWKATISDQGEDFRLGWLRDSAGIDPLDWWLWGLGLGDGHPYHRLRSPWDIITGDGSKGADPHDWTNFGDYLYRDVDSLVFQNKFRSTVAREAGAGTNFALPFWNSRATASTKWKHDFTLFRAQPLQEEQHWVWPWWSVSLQIPTIHEKFGVTKKHLTKLILDSRFTFEKDSTAKPYAPSEDLTKRSYNFDPLLKLSMLTKKRKIDISNAFSVRYETGWRRPKIDPFDGRYTADTISFHKPWRPPSWIYTDLIDEESWTFHNRLLVGYDLPMGKGFQLFQKYIFLKNPLHLEFSLNLERILSKRLDYIAPAEFHPLSPDGAVEFAYDHIFPDGSRQSVYQFDASQMEPTSRTVPTDSWLITLRPTANYRFTKNIQGEAWLEYSWYNSSSALSDDKLNEQILSYEVRVQIDF